MDQVISNTIGSPMQYAMHVVKELDEVLLLTSVGTKPPFLEDTIIEIFTKPMVWQNSENPRLGKVFHIGDVKTEGSEGGTIKTYKVRMITTSQV